MLIITLPAITLFACGHHMNLPDGANLLAVHRGYDAMNCVDKPSCRQKRIVAVIHQGGSRMICNPVDLNLGVIYADDSRNDADRDGFPLQHRTLLDMQL